MGQRVVLVSDGHRVEGCGPDGEFANRFLAHLGSRAFSPATVRAYAYDLLNFLRFLAGRDARLADVVATDLFDYLAWQQRPAGTAGQAVVRLGAGRGAGPATMNRRIAAVRGLFEFAVMTGARAENPVPAARRSTGLRSSRRGLLGHIGPGRPRGGGRLVRQPRRLPESLEPEDVAAFVVDLRTFRDRAITLVNLPAVVCFRHRGPPLPGGDGCFAPSSIRQERRPAPSSHHGVTPQSGEIFQVPDYL